MPDTDKPVRQVVATLFQNNQSFVIVVNTQGLRDAGGCGFPPHLLAQWDRVVVFRLDSEYFTQMAWEVLEDRLEVNMGFDDLYEVRIPWKCIEVLNIGFNVPKEYEAPTLAPARPKLRLVTNEEES